MTTTTTNTTAALENIDSLRLPELQVLFAEVTGKTTRSPNKKFLIRKIREILAEQAAAAAKNEATATAEPAPAADTKPQAKAKRTRRIVSVPQPTAADTTAEATPDTTTEATQAAQRDDAADTAAEATATEKRLSQLSVQELQQRYLAVVGRPTGSSHKRYMIWKIREVEKGRIQAGPTNRRDPNEPEPDYMVLPLRMEADVVAKLDAARERIGDKSRMDLLRKAIAAYLASNGETDAAAAVLPSA